MDERQRHVIERIRDASGLEDLYAQGHSPEDVKVALLDLFMPYSQNADALKKYVSAYMVPDAVNLARIAGNAWATQLLNEALRISRRAIAANRHLAIHAIGDRLASVNAGLGVYWSQYHLAQDLNQLELEEFVHESLRLIGTMLEGVLKPLLYGLAHHARIGRGQQPTVQDVDTMTLGKVAELLIQEAGTPVHYSICGVRLNQWRNIAQHFTAQVHNTEIVCTYNDGRAQVRLTRDDLAEVLEDVVRAHRALKVAHTVVFFDHLDEMQQAGVSQRAALRPEASLTVLVSGLAAQGFQVVDARFSEQESVLILQDVSSLDPSMRSAHSSQFVIPLFAYRPAERVTVEYRRNDGTPYLRTSASRELIERAEQANDSLIVAREAELTVLRGDS